MSRISHDLNVAGTVPQINKNNPSMVPTIQHPASVIETVSSISDRFQLSTQMGSHVVAGQITYREFFGDGKN